MPILPPPEEPKMERYWSTSIGTNEDGIDLMLDGSNLQIGIVNKQGDTALRNLSMLEAKSLIASLSALVNKAQQWETYVGMLPNEALKTDIIVLDKYDPKKHGG